MEDILLRVLFVIAVISLIVYAVTGIFLFMAIIAIAFIVACIVASAI